MEWNSMKEPVSPAFEASALPAVYSGCLAAFELAFGHYIHIQRLFTVANFFITPNIQ